MSKRFKPLNIDDIKIGDTINTAQLANVFDTYVLMINTSIIQDESNCQFSEGKVVFIGKTQDSRYKKAFIDNTINGKRPAIFYQRSSTDKY